MTVRWLATTVRRPDVEDALLGVARDLGQPFTVWLRQAIAMRLEHDAPELLQRLGDWRTW